MRYGPVSNNPTRSFIHLSPLSCTPHSDLHSSAHLPPRHSDLPPWQLQKGTGSSFLTSSTTDMRAREFSCWGLCSVPGRILSSIPSLSPPELPQLPVLTIKNVSRPFQVSPGGSKGSQAEICWSKAYVSLPGPLCSLHLSISFSQLRGKLPTCMSISCTLQLVPFKLSFP